MVTCETDEIENANAMLHYTANNPVSIFTTFSASCIVLFTFSVNAKKTARAHTHTLTHTCILGDNRSSLHKDHFIVYAGHGTKFNS